MRITAGATRIMPRRRSALRPSEYFCFAFASAFAVASGFVVAPAEPVASAASTDAGVVLFDAVITAPTLRI